MRGSKRDLLDIKLISSPLPPSPLSLSTPTFSNALTGGISWKKQAKGLPVADQAWAGIAMSADGTVSYASSSYASFSFSLEGVLRSLPALVSLVSLISFVPLSSLSRIQTHSLRFCNNSSLRLLSPVAASTRAPLSPATATTSGPRPAPQRAAGETSA